MSQSTVTPTTVAELAPPTDTGKLLAEVSVRGPRDAADLLVGLPDAVIVDILQKVNPDLAGQTLWNLPDAKRSSVFAAAPRECAAQWTHNHSYPPDSVGRMMDPPIGVFSPDTTAADAIEQLRDLVKKAFITYGFIVDRDGRLLGILVMRELMLARPEQRLSEIILRNPFALKPEMPLMDAMKAVLSRHFPVYPVCDDAGKLVGLVRGQTLFEKQAVEISAQAGAMVGVEKEERLATAWPRSFKYRHPWLQINLLTAFVAGAVVSGFEDTINKSIVLAAFLPVLAGQSGNTGCQALAVVLRGFTLGEFDMKKAPKLILKEAWVGLLNGIFVGLVAAVGMLLFASRQTGDNAMPMQKRLMLAGVVWVAMSLSCMVSGISGALIPMALKKLGFDPVTASSIFLTTATDVASMGALLTLATYLVK